jgi:hypothetical protein
MFRYWQTHRQRWSVRANAGTHRYRHVFGRADISLLLQGEMK